MHKYMFDMYYGGLMFISLWFERLVILQSVHKVKLKLSSYFTRVRFAEKKHDDKINFTLLSDCRINNLLSPRGTNFSPRQYNGEASHNLQLPRKFNRRYWNT